ncbi:MAG: hypothetical protein QM726_26315 [Chitinophagaceae bacterium]
MRNRLCAAFCLFFLFSVSASKAQKKLVIIGSSTSACYYNPTYYTLPYQDCYVGRLQTYYNAVAPLDTIIDGDIAKGGTNCYTGMPSSYISPYAAPYQPDPAYNITKALSLSPDVILVNYPTNGYDVLSVTDILFCLRTIRDSANAKGVPCFVTTSQPRTSANFNTSVMKAKLAELKDSILLEFGRFAIDFYNGLYTPADSSLLYDQGDHIHMTADGHAILAQRVISKNVFASSLLPTKFLQFNTVYKNNTNIVSWTTATETDVESYEIQRSGDGIGFAKIGSVPATNNASTNQYRYTDNNPLLGWNYYKVISVDKDGKKQASAIMSVQVNTNGKLMLSKIFARSATEVVVETQGNETQQAELQLINNMGMPVSKKSIIINAGTNAIYLQTPSLANGIYHVKLVTNKETLTGSFIKAN